MKKRPESTQRTQAENEAGAGVAQLVEPMLAGMMTTREHLLAWVHAQGLAALDDLLRAEAVTLAGPKGRHQPSRTHHHWGTTATELTFGGRRVQVPRPRVRPTTGGLATLPSVAAFRDRDPLTARMMHQLLAGVSTRQYEASLEARPRGRRTRGSSKSAVSRSVVRGARQRLHEQLTRRLEGARGGGPLHGWGRGGAADGDRRARDHAGCRFFATTNCIENLIGTLRHVTRNIKRWRDGDMRRRWIGLGLLRAAERFRRIKHHAELSALVTALGTRAASERAA